MSEKENKKRNRHFDRVTLDGSTLDRLDAWIKQVEAVKPGVVLARKDVLNWILVSLPERLTASQEKALSEAFYSELRYIQFAAREIKAAAARGEHLTLKDIEQRGAAMKEPPVRKPRKAARVGDSAQAESVAADGPISDQSPA